MVGQRIALWAEKFVGTPYDPDPLGAYVTSSQIVFDTEVDCMYLTFRAVELALTETPEDAEALALVMRFKKGKGVVLAGKVANYEDRYQYAMDMIRGGKWGADVTASLGLLSQIKGSRGMDKIKMLSTDNISEASKNLRSGDIVFFIKDPARRVVGEVVGHIGIIKREPGGLYLIHASGRKNHGGVVKKVLFPDYASSMNFVGIKVTRFAGGRK